MLSLCGTSYIFVPPQDSQKMSQMVDPVLSTSRIMLTACVAWESSCILGVSATTSMLHFTEEVDCLYRSRLVDSSIVCLLDKCHETLNMSGYQCVRRLLSPTCYPTPHPCYYLSLRCSQESVKVTGVCNVASFRLAVLILSSALARFQAMSIRSRVQAVGPPDPQFCFALF